MEQTKTEHRRLFHETVVDAIKRAEWNGMLLLGDLLRETIIPANHDEILAAWRRWKERSRPGDDNYAYICEAEQSIIAEKERVQKEAREAKVDDGSHYALDDRFLPV